MFSDMAIKNFKGNVRKYISIFLCCSLCVLVLQVFLIILNNQKLTSVLVSKSIKMLLSFSLIVLVIFMFFFISYAVQTFLKLRSKEFGLYLILGMLRKELTKMIFIETGIIILVALIVGMFLGTVLSYILFVFFKFVFEIENITFTLHYNSYIQTIAIFLLIFFVQFFFVWLYSKRLQLTEIIKYSKKPENIRMPGITSSLVLSIVAIVLLFFSFHSLFTYISGERINNAAPSTPITFIFSCFISIYILISRASSLYTFVRNQKGIIIIIC